MLEVNIKKKIGRESIEAIFTHSSGILAIMGRSGAGKTTLLNLVAGIQSPDFGYIKLDNQCFFDKDRRISLKMQDRNIGYVFQELLLFPKMTLYENIRFAQEARNKIDEDFILELLNLMKIEHLKDKYPNEVSGGEKQRCALARALSSKPKIILIDEGFSALDPDTKIIIMENIKTIINRIASIGLIVTHNPDDAKFLADDYFVFK